jgi:TetR/AcrR family acrAB operon transcriptional repressor
VLNIPSESRRHERILAAARQIVLSRSLPALSVQAVTTDADVSKSAVSYHFGSKDGLVRAIIESMAVKQDDEARIAVSVVIGLDC